jgi:hypothetical protein
MDYEFAVCQLARGAQRIPDLPFGNPAKIEPHAFGASSTTTNAASENRQTAKEPTLVPGLAMLRITLCHGTKTHHAETRIGVKLPSLPDEC